MRLDHRAIAVLILALAAAMPAAGQPVRFGDPHLEPVFHPLPGNVEVLRLENGLEVLLMRNPAQPMVGIYTQVRVGSAREDYRTSGMSHMLEHLLFNGTDKYTQEELYDLADNAGAYNNATTSDFFTNFMLVAPAAELETGLDIQSQMLFHSVVPEDKFLKEQGIVLGELVAARDRPGHFSETAMRQALFQGSSLELPTLGTRATIEHMTRDDVYAFYKRWYVPNNMIMTIAGNFDGDRTMELIEQYFGSIAPGTLPDEDFRPAALIDGTTTVARRGGDRRLAALSFQAPGYGMDDFFPFLVMTEMLTLEGSGILTRAIDDLDQDSRPELSAWWDRAPGFSRLNLEFDLPEAADPARLYRLVQDALTGAVEMGITGEDILGIVRMSETHTLLEREQLRMTGIYIAEPLVLGGPDFFLSYLDRLRGVTAEDVTRVMTNWLVEAPCLAVLIEPDPQAAAGPPGAGMPPGMQMPAGMQMSPAMAAAMQKMGAGDGAAKPGAAETPAVIEPAPLKVDRSVLANGAVLVSQTNPDSPLQAIHLAVRGRALIDRDNAGAGALDVVHRLLEEGVAGCDRTCLARRLRRLGAVVKLVDDGRIPMDDYYTNGRFSFIRVETAAGNGAEALELVTELIQHAVFGEDVFERIRTERVTELGREGASARTVANGLLAGALYGDHPLVLPPEGGVETLAGLDYDQVRLVYRRAFSPENLVFSIIGPAGHAELKEAVERLLPGQGVPGPGVPPLPVTAGPDSAGATLGGEMAAIRLGSVLKVAPEDEAALALAVAILSDRMAMDLREARGLSYSVGASLDPAGDRAEFTAWINPPVERADEALAALRAFVADFDAATITQEEADKIRSARRGRTLMRRLSSMGQAYYLAMAELEGDIQGYLQALTRYEDVALGDLRRVSDLYLKTMPLVTVVVD
ncbi:MAG: M16 family metallopeptidase [Candidatus Krumholzibacteriia bacterium]